MIIILFKCTLTCVFQKYHLFNSDGNVDYNALRKFLKNIDEKVIQKTILMTAKMYVIPMWLEQVDVCEVKRKFMFLLNMKQFYI